MGNEAASIFLSHILPLLNIVSTPGAAIIMWLIANKNNHRENALKEHIRLLTEIPLTRKNGILYDNDGIPYCPVCYGKERHIVPLGKFIDQKDNKKVAALRCFDCPFTTNDPSP